MRPFGTAAAVGLAAGLLAALSAPAAAAPSGGMVLVCDDGRSLTRANGTSWWGLTPDGTPDGSVYVTRHLQITDLQTEQLQYEKSYGTDRPKSTDICVAQHGPFPDEGYPGSIWTVTLRRTT